MLEKFPITFIIAMLIFSISPFTSFFIADKIGIIHLGFLFMILQVFMIGKYIQFNLLRRLNNEM